MRYFEKISEVGKLPKLSPWLKGALISAGILGTGYGLHRLTKKPERVWVQ